MEQINNFDLVNRLNNFLQTEAITELEKTIKLYGLEKVASQEILATARATRNINLVIFLSTLGVENNINKEESKFFHCIYSNLKEESKDLDKKTLKLLGLIKNEFADLNDLKELVINDSKINVNLLYELFLDFSKWEAAQLLIEINSQKNNFEIRIFLGFTKSLLFRQSIKYSHSDYTNIAQNYDQICTRIDKTGNVPEIIKILKAAHAKVLSDSKEFGLAVIKYEEILDYEKSAAILKEISKAHCKNGNILKSILTLDMIIEILIAKVKNKAPENFGILFNNPTDQNFTIEKAKLAIQDITFLAKALNLEIFIVSGTLLGFKRENNILKHDKDLDFGITDIEGLYKLANLGRQSNLFHIDSDYFKEDNTVQVPFIHKSTGIWIDLFYYKEEFDGYTTGVDFQFGYRQKFKFTKFCLEKNTFLGSDIYTPSNIEENLVENFGDWHKPDASYISHLESPSTLDKGGKEYQLALRIWIIKSIQDMNAIKLKKTIAIAKKYGANEGSISSNFVKELENLNLIDVCSS